MTEPAAPTAPMLLTLAIQPQQLSEALDEVAQEVTNALDEDQPRLKNRVREIRLNIKKYANTYSQSLFKIQQTIGFAPSEFSQTKAYQQMETVMKGHKEFTEHSVLVNQNIKNSLKSKFDISHKHGIREAKHSDDFYRIKAEETLLLKGEGRPIVYSTSKFFNFFVEASKILVGVASSISLDSLFNPDQYYMLTIGALLIGITVSLLLSILTEWLSHSGKIAKDSRKYTISIILIVVGFMFAEGFLNYEGIISVSRELAAESATEGLLLEEPELTESEEAPTHYAVLVFTLCLVGFASFASVLKGRRKAVIDVYEDKVNRTIAELKKEGELSEAAKAIDEPAFLESVRKNIKRPNHKPTVSWYNPVVKHLSKQEREIDQKASQISEQLAEKGEAIQQDILSLSNEIQASQVGRKKLSLVSFDKAN